MSARDATDDGRILLTVWDCGHVEVDDGGTHECDGRDACSGTLRPFAPTDSVEYRVRWRREGRQGTSQIYQSEDAARRKADRLLALDAMKNALTGHRFDDMPDLVGPPVIESRPAGDWAPVEAQLTTASDEACASMEEWIEPGSQSGVAF